MKFRKYIRLHLCYETKNKSIKINIFYFKITSFTPKQYTCNGKIQGISKYKSITSEYTAREKPCIYITDRLVFAVAHHLSSFEF